MVVSGCEKVVRRCGGCGWEMCWKREDLFGEVWEDEKILIPS
jgi:hypothetical protein